jgi:hypothetical protein
LKARQVIGQDRAEVEAERLAMEKPEHPKEKKTEDELAAMIHADLSHMDGCPQRGVTVTVYGIPWKAMLTFGAAAGPVRNKAELEVYFRAITESAAAIIRRALDRNFHPAIVSMATHLQASESPYVMIAVAYGTP